MSRSQSSFIPSAVPTTTTFPNDDEVDNKWNWLTDNEQPQPFAAETVGVMSSMDTSSSDVSDDAALPIEEGGGGGKQTMFRYECNLRHLPSSPKKWRRVGVGSSPLAAASSVASPDFPSSSSAVASSEKYSSGSANDNDDKNNNACSGTVAEEQPRPLGRCSHTVTPINKLNLLLFCGGYMEQARTTSSSRLGCGGSSSSSETSPSFVHLDDMWILNSITARWTQIHPEHTTPPGDDVEGHKRKYGEERETVDSYWGMKFGPKRRGHVAGYYYCAANGDDSTSAAAPSGGRKTLRGRLVVFGGVTNANSYKADTNEEATATRMAQAGSRRTYRCLDDVWVFDLPSSQWRQIHPSTSSCPGGSGPRPRRHAISWIDNDYFYVFGGKIETETGAMMPIDYTDEQQQQAQQQQQDGLPNAAVVPSNIYKLGPLSQPVHTWEWHMQQSYNTSFLHKLSPNGPTVTSSARAFGALACAPSVVVGRKLWIFGGLDFYDRLLRRPRHLPASNLLYRLDLDTFEWVILHVPNNAPCPRFCHGMTSIGQYLIIAGGIGIKGNDDTDTNTPRHERTIVDLYIFDTETMKWKEERQSDIAGSWPSERNAFVMSKLGTDKIVLFGGGLYPWSYFDDTYALEFDLPIKVPKPSCSMQNDVCSDLFQFCKTGQMSDVTLIVGEGHYRKSYPVHKVILAARCQFFRTMFSGPYMESTSKEIVLPNDIHPDAVDVALEFLYSGSVDSHGLVQSDDDDDRDDCPGIISSTLRLSDLWGIANLSASIEDALASSAWSMRRGDADPIALISFAKAHNCRRLKMQGLEFARRKWNTLRDSDAARSAEPEILEEIEDFVTSLL